MSCGWFRHAWAVVYGKRARVRLPVVELGDRRALERWRPADEETVARARRLKEQALLDLGMTHSTIASWIYSKCSHQIPTTAVDTAAVLASGDGTCLLLYNPDFFVALGLEGVRFVLFHEARHLVQRHLFADPVLRDDQVFTLACEVTINHVAMVRLGQDGLPEIDGEPVGVDPAAIHRAYRHDLAEQGLDWLPYDDFVATDMDVYRELRRMRNPPVPGPVCVHLLLDGDALDQETVDRISSDVLRSVLIAARRAARSPAGNCSTCSTGPGARAIAPTGSGAISARTPCAATPSPPAGSTGGSSGWWTCWPPSSVPASG